MTQNDSLILGRVLTEISEIADVSVDGLRVKARRTVGLHRSARARMATAATQEQAMRVGPRPAANGDLTTVKDCEGQAQGEIIAIKGRVLNCNGEPVRGARLVIWQANSFGRYAHPNDANPAPLDNNFNGFADILVRGAKLVAASSSSPGLSRR